MSYRLAAIGAMLLTGVSAARGSVSMQIVADNDFALLSGTSDNATRLIYQNNVSWPDQLSSLLTFSFDLKAGESYFYLLGMGGGGEENISGTVNGKDLTTINVSMSSDIGPFLTGFEAQAHDGTVADGTFSALYSDVRSALPSLTWSAPTPTNPEADGVASQSPTGQGFHFDASTAHLFRFSAKDVDVTASPEPSTCWLLVVAGAVCTLSRFRRFSSGK